jgi:hypothetical protein
MNFNNSNSNNKYHKLENNNNTIEINEIINDIIGDIELNYMSSNELEDTDSNIYTVYVNNAVNTANTINTVDTTATTNTVDLYYENECRICFEEETFEDPFIWPCRCNGTSKYVHRSCLNTWRNENVNNPAFERCMECRYEYTFINKYPHEFDAIVTINYQPITYIIYVLPVILIYPISEYNRMNDNIILTTYGGKNNSLNYYMAISEDMYYVLNYDICINIILFHQLLLFFVYYIYFIFKKVYRTCDYFRLLTRSMLPTMFTLGKYMLLINVVGKEPGWVSFYIILSVFIIVLEPFAYLTIISRHNKIINELELDNKYIIQNYNNGDEDDIITDMI